MVPKLQLDHCKWLSHQSNYVQLFSKFVNALAVCKRALHSSFVVLSKSVVNSEFVDETHKITNAVKYSVLYKSVSKGVCKRALVSLMNLDIFVEQISLLVNRRKQTSETAGKFASRAHQRRRLLRIVNSNFYRTATQNYDVTQRRRRAKVVDS